VSKFASRKVLCAFSECDPFEALSDHLFTSFYDFLMSYDHYLANSDG
jgi:hypothetical protein